VGTDHADNQRWQLNLRRLFGDRSDQERLIAEAANASLERLIEGRKRPQQLVPVDQGELAAVMLEQHVLLGLKEGEFSI
jgi:hypothetical protein